MAKKRPPTNSETATRHSTTHRLRAADHAPRPLADPVAALPPRVESLPLRQIVRHPDNRAPTAAAIDELAASLAQRGQLEPVVVRPLPPHHPARAESVTGVRFTDSGPCFQLVSGETRCLAAHALGLAQIEARVAVDLSDAGALAWLGAANATRRDLTPLERAQLLAKLCQPAGEGGGGLSREAAGKIFGLTTGQAVSNCLKLLELPPDVQQLVAAGRVPESFARLAAPWLVVPDVFREFVTEAKQWTADTRPTREDCVDQLERRARQATRSLAPANRKKLNEWSIDWCQERLFELDDELRGKLRPVTLPASDNGPPEERALNKSLWDAKQAAAAKQLKTQLATKRTAAAERSAGSETGTTKPLTQAEAAAAARERAAQLAQRVDAWRHGWLRELLADRVANGGWPAEKLLLWLLAARLDFKAHNQFGMAEKIAAMAECEYQPATPVARLVASLIETAAARSTWRQLVAHALRQEETRQWPVWPLELLEAVARDYQLDLADAWACAQASGQHSPRLAEFFALHQSGQLDALGDELGVRLVDAPTKAAKLKLLATCPRILKLPRAIAPLTTPQPHGPCSTARRRSG